MFVADSKAAAEPVRDDLIAAGYRGFAPEALVVGDIESVAAEFDRYGALGYEEVVVRHVTVPQADALASFARLSEVRARLQ